MDDPPLSGGRCPASELQLEAHPHGRGTMVGWRYERFARPVLDRLSPVLGQDVRCPLRIRDRPNSIGVYRPPADSLIRTGWLAVTSRSTKRTVA